MKWSEQEFRTEKTTEDGRNYNIKKVSRFVCLRTVKLKEANIEKKIKQAITITRNRAVHSPAIKLRICKTIIKTYKDAKARHKPKESKTG